MSVASVPWWAPLAVTVAVVVLWRAGKAFVAYQRAKAKHTETKIDDAAWEAADKALGDEPPEV